MEENITMAEQIKVSRKIEVKAVMSGVFYRKPAPDKPSYVDVGDEVTKGQVLGLLETMKVFQKIKSPSKGKIKEILAENENTVKDGQVMFVIEPGQGI